MPEPFVVRFLVTPVSVFKIVTAAAGMAAPVASVTVPRISPEFVFCAKANPGASTKRNESSAFLTSILFKTPHLRKSSCYDSAHSSICPEATYAEVLYGTLPVNIGELPEISGHYGGRPAHPGK